MITKWLRHVAPTDEDENLGEGRNCTDILEELVRLLASLCAAAEPDSHPHRLHRPRVVLGAVKRAGKIAWRQNELVDLKRRLLVHRDDVHVHLSSRTGNHVKVVL
jgi:hypothetical protein